jgi:hypothetical protein
MPRWKLLVALAGLAVVIAAGAVVLWPRADRVTRENYDRIHEGMTPTEVGAILRAEDKPKQKPAAISGGYKRLVAEYGKFAKESHQAYKKAKTEEERQRIRTAYLRTRAEFTGRFLTFAEEHPKDEDALLALFFILHPDTEADARYLDAAVGLILKDHVASERLTNPPILQMVYDSPAAETLLRGVLGKSPHRATRAQAGLSLALILNDRAHPRQAAARPNESAVALAKETEELFERVSTEYADIGDVAEKAKRELFEIRLLAVGKTAPDIRGKDSDEREFNLSDYRGKVVVLDFWAEW